MPNEDICIQCGEIYDKHTCPRDSSWLRESNFQLEHEVKKKFILRFIIKLIITCGLAFVLYFGFNITQEIRFEKTITLPPITIE
jgi:hypothetical protein